MEVAEIGGEQRQLPVNIHSGVVPVQQRAHSEGVSEVVRAHVTALAAPVETGLAAQRRERGVERLAGKSTLGPGDEERPASMRTAVAQPRVPVKRLDRGRMQGNQALFGLPGTDVQRPALEVDVDGVQAGSAVSTVPSSDRA